MSESDESKTNVLSINDILTKDDLTVIDVDVPEWGGVVKIRPFTKRQQQHIRQTASASSVNGEVNVDEFERLVFLAAMVEPEIDEEQYNLLCEKSATAIDGIIKSILEINGMGDSEKQVAASFQE